MRTNITVVVDGNEVLLSNMNKNTRSVSSVIAWMPAYSRKVKLVFDNRLMDGISILAKFQRLNRVKRFR